jgi:broad specificity phosphatase PhoE
MTTHIYLIRHGEVHNPKGTLYARLPGYHLSKKGKQEIEQTAEFLKSRHIDYIYASPMLRAKQTAEIIRSILNLSKIFITKYILEVKTSFQGRLFADLTPDQSEIYLSPNRQQTDETLPQIAKRMERFIDLVSKKHQGKHIAVISHGDPLMILRAVLSDLPAEYTSVRKGNGFTYIKHGEVVELQINDEGKKTIKTIFQPQVK